MAEGDCNVCTELIERVTTLESFDKSEFIGSELKAGEKALHQQKRC